MALEHLIAILKAKVATLPEGDAATKMVGNLLVGGDWSVRLETHTDHSPENGRGIGSKVGDTTRGDLITTQSGGLSFRQIMAKAKK